MINVCNVLKCPVCGRRFKGQNVEVGFTAIMLS